MIYRVCVRISTSHVKKDFMAISLFLQLWICLDNGKKQNQIIVLEYCGESHSAYTLECSYHGDQWKLGKTERAKASTNESGNQRDKEQRPTDISSSALIYQPDQESGLSTLPVSSTLDRAATQIAPSLSFLNCTTVPKCAIVCFVQPHVISGRVHQVMLFRFI